MDVEMAKGKVEGCDLRTYVGPIAAALLLHCLFVAVYVAAFKGDISSLLCAPQSAIGRWPYEAVTAGFPTNGFDGQFYYVLARNPWRKTVDFIDLPSYRHARLLYPALTWALTGGDPKLLLWAMPAINLLTIAVMTAIGVRLAVRFGRNAWWGAVVPLAVNAGAPMLRNLTDPLAVATAFGLIAASLASSRPAIVFLWACAAILSREQNAAIVAIVLFEAVVARQWGIVRVVAAALVLMLGWQLLLRDVYGVWPVVPENTGRPLSGLIYRWTNLTGSVGSSRVPIHAIAMVHLSALIGLSLVLPWLGASRLATLVAWAGASLALLGGQAIFENGQTYTRVFYWMPLGIWLWTVQSGRRWPLLVLLPATFWPLAAILQVWTM